MAFTAFASYETDDRIDQHDAEDDPGIDPFLQGDGDQRGRQQDVNQGLMELQEEAGKRPPAFFRGDRVGTEALTPVFDVEQVEAFARIAFQEIDHLFGGKIMPVLSDQFLHGLTILSFHGNPGF